MSTVFYTDDGVPSRKLNDAQYWALNSVRNKISTGEYVFTDNDCLCGASGGEVLSRKDRYGLSIDFLLCGECGLVRAARVLNSTSISAFYKDYYRMLYVGMIEPGFDFVSGDQTPRGKRLVELFDSVVGLDKVDKVFEIGCSSGGIIAEFKKKGKKVQGCDYDLNFLNYGKQLGLDLYYGDISEEYTDLESLDLIVMSHVLEHITDPASSIVKSACYLKNGGYMLIEVPGTFNEHNPIDYFHIAHVFNFHKVFLERFFSGLGFEIVYGDEVCTFVIRKVGPVVNNGFEFSDSLRLRAVDVLPHIRRQYKRNKVSIFRRMAIRFLTYIRVKNFLKKFLRRFD